MCNCFLKGKYGDNNVDEHVNFLWQFPVWYLFDFCRFSRQHNTNFTLELNHKGKIWKCYVPPYMEVYSRG